MPGMPAPWHHYAAVGLLAFAWASAGFPCPVVNHVERLQHQGTTTTCPSCPKSSHTNSLQRWGSLAFCDYVEGLQRQADEALASASQAERWVGEWVWRHRVGCYIACRHRVQWQGASHLLACHVRATCRAASACLPTYHPLLPPHPTHPSTRPPYLPTCCRQEVERRFLQVCELEQSFWQMAYSATAFE